MVVLDATAGNRKIWGGRNPPKDLVVFMDKEHDLLIPPDIIADHRQPPFRNGVFSCVIFDPPYWLGGAPWMMNKKENPYGGGITYYGKYDSKTEMLSSINKAQEAFKKLTNRLCFKWNDTYLSLWKILPFFKGWHRILVKEHKSPRKTRKKTTTYWVTFVRCLG